MVKVIYFLNLKIYLITQVVQISHSDMNRHNSESNVIYELIAVCQIQQQHLYLY